MKRGIPLAIRMAALLLIVFLSGCGGTAPAHQTVLPVSRTQTQTASEPEFFDVGTVAGRVTLSLFVPQGESLAERQVTLEGLSAQKIMDRLIAFGAAGKGTQVLSLCQSREEKSRLILSLSGFSVPDAAGDGERRCIASLVNTYLAAYGGYSLRLMVGDGDLVTRHRTYSFFLKAFDPALPHGQGLPMEERERAVIGERVALTFDDGPTEEHTRQIAEKLCEYDAHATFFVVGDRVNGKKAEGLLAAAKCANEVEIHGYTHNYDYGVCTESQYQSELSRTAQVIRSLTGKDAALLRPIGGSITAMRVRDCPYTVVHWSLDSEDWRYAARGDGITAKNVQTIVNNVLDYVVPGDVILMHDLRKNSYEAFCRILDGLYEMPVPLTVTTVTGLFGKENLGRGQMVHCLTAHGIQ